MLEAIDAAQRRFKEFHGHRLNAHNAMEFVIMKNTRRDSF